MQDGTDDALLPPLPRPLVPTHSRSFSSSSSSSSSVASEADEAQGNSPFSFPTEWTSTSSTIPAQADKAAAAGDWRDVNGPSGQGERAVGRADVNANTLDGTSPPLGMLAEEQPFAEAFADDHPSWTSLQPSVPATAGHNVLSSTGPGNRSAISAADLDFPRSSLSPSPAPSRSSGTDTVDGLPSPTPTTAHSASSHHGFFSRVSPTLSAAAQSRFASTSAVGLRASPSPSSHARQSPSLPSSPPALPAGSNHGRTEQRDPPTPDLLGPLRTYGSVGESLSGGLPASASVALDTDGTVRRRVPFASASGAEIVDGKGEVEGAGSTETTLVRDEPLLRRRKYRARGSYTPATSMSGGSVDIGAGVAPSAPSREILDEVNARGGGVASSSAVQDPALRRTTTAETLRGIRAPNLVGSSNVDEFGTVSRVDDRDPDRAVPRSRTMGDLQGEAGRRSSTADPVRDLARSASTASRTYGYRSGSRASQVLASVRSHSTLSQYDSPTRASVTARSRVRSNELDPPPRSVSTSTYQLRYGERERASSALGTTEGRDRRGYAALPGEGDRTRSRRLPADGSSRVLLPGGVQSRAGVEQSQSPTAMRAATSLGTAASARCQRDLELGVYSSEDEHVDGDGDLLDRRLSVARSRTSPAGTPARVQRGIRPSAADGLLATPTDGRGEAGGARAPDEVLEAELERTPTSGKKHGVDIAFASTPSRDRVRRALYPDSSDARAALFSAEVGSRENGSRSVRRQRSVTGSEIGSEAWLAEIDRVRTRTNRSRLSRRSSSSSVGDAASVVTTRTQADVDRERTVRAINDVLRDQGIVAAVASDSFGLASPTSSNSSPRKRESHTGFDRRPSTVASHRLAFGRDSPAGVPPSRSLHSDLSRRSSILSIRPGRSETALRGLIDRAGPNAAEHHQLLLAALDQFDKHFTEAAQREGLSTLPSSPVVGPSPPIELIKRMDGLVTSTTQLNSGLRGLLEAVKADQVEAQLADEGQGSRSSLSHFERSVNALLRTSEDQIRSLTEDLVAIIRLDRERMQSGTGSGITDNRPTSRASTYRSSLTGSAGRVGDSMQSPPRRATTASPYQGSTVSHASSAYQRHTVGYAGSGPSPRSPLAQVGGTPSPAGRRESAHARSPLAEGAAPYETPSRTTSLRRRSAVNGITGSASYIGRNGLTGLGLPLPPADESPDGRERRSKTSDATVRPPSSTQTRVARATYPVTSVDSTQATTQSSPTHPSAGFEVSSLVNDRDLPELPQNSHVVSLQRFPSGTEALHPTISATSAATLPNESPASTRKRSLRMSGGLGAVIKNAFTGGGSRKSASEGVTSSPDKVAPPPPVPPLPTSGSTELPERSSSVTSSASIRRGPRRMDTRAQDLAAIQ
ncbi:hypothetical protein JCM3774_003844 [Rhodotorula dairenensis]